MFCENCGREVRREDLDRLLKPDGEPVLCPGCGKRLETAEFCGGFWGLIASASEEEKGTGTRFHGLTEADRILARKILAGENSHSDEKKERTRGDQERSGNPEGGANGPAGADTGRGERTGQKSRKEMKEDAADTAPGREGAAEKRSGAPWPLLLLLCAAALCAGFLIGRIFPAGGNSSGDGTVQGGTDIQTSSSGQSDTVPSETREELQEQVTALPGGTTAAASEQSSSSSAEAASGWSTEQSTASSAEAASGWSSEQSTASSAEAASGWSSEQSTASSAEEESGWPAEESNEASGEEYY